MKRLIAFLIGAAFLGSTYAVEAASLYETVKESMDLELRKEEVEDELKEFIAALAEEKKWGVTAEDVEGIVRGSTAACSKHKELQGIGCTDALQEIREVVSYENEIRKAGRRLQAIATSYELPFSEIPRTSQTLFGDLQGVVNIWKAGTGATTFSGTGTVRTEQIDDEDVTKAIEELGTALEDLKKEEQIAAVWKYQYGYRLLSGMRRPSFPAPGLITEDCENSERQYLCKRWEDVEAALRKIWSELPTTFDPPLGSKESAYFQFDKETLEALPDNIIVWARMDAKAPFPLSDVGLQWEYGFDPVLPSLLMEKEEKPILGGAYPPEPALDAERMRYVRQGDPVPFDAEGSGLCSMAGAQRGYLCRPVIVMSDADCPKPEDADKSAVVLVGCKTTGEEKKTEAGPDVCKDVAWRDTGSGSIKPVCTPEELSKYRNTIGNNLCFIGQCAEQSLETGRITPGRTPAGVQDEAFPYDDPLTGSPLGNFLTSPTSGQPILPPYNPLQPVREFEAALCALVGLPASTPPALCTISTDRRTDSPLADPLSTLLSIVQVQGEQKMATSDLSMLAQSVGTRIGTDLYARNLRMMSKSLSEVIGMATRLLNDVKSIDFPTEMCALTLPSPPEE